MITAKMVYDAIESDGCGYVRKNTDEDLTSVCVDGDIDCEAIAKFLNDAQDAGKNERK